MLIRLLILDVDGVLTGGGITLSAEGEDTKTFHVQDGYAIKRWQQAGGKVAILSGRRSDTVEVRARELDIEIVHTGVDRKSAVYEEIIGAAGVSDESVCVVGDDIPDIALMARAGLSVAVANALPVVKREADFVTRRCGGAGAVAEVVEHLLRLGGRWQRGALIEG